MCRNHHAHEHTTNGYHTRSEMKRSVSAAVLLLLCCCSPTLAKCACVSSQRPASIISKLPYCRICSGQCSTMWNFTNRHSDFEYPSNTPFISFSTATISAPSAWRAPHSERKYGRIAVNFTHLHFRLGGPCAFHVRAQQNELSENPLDLFGAAGGKYPAVADGKPELQQQGHDFVGG